MAVARTPSRALHTQQWMLEHRLLFLRPMTKYAAVSHIIPRLLNWQDSLTSWLAFLSGSPALPPSSGFFAQHPGLMVHVLFLRCHDSSSWELGLTPADTTCWCWKHCLFPPTNFMQTSQAALLPCFLLFAKDCRSGACQENRQRSYAGFIFPRRPPCQERTGGQRHQCASTSLTSEMLFSSLLGLSFTLSLSCYLGLSVPYSHLKLCFVKAGYCQCSVFRLKKYLQRVRLKWVPQPSRCNGLCLCFCKTRCQGSDMWKGEWLLKRNLVNKISGYHILSWSYCSPKCLKVISQAPRNPEIGLNNMRLESVFWGSCSCFSILKH